MNSSEVTIVRVYLTEAEGLEKQIIAYLHDEHKVRGATVFRGITGFGQSGELHSSKLLDLSLDLPLVIEFFDEPEKITKIIEYLKSLVDVEHIVFWSAQVAS